MTRTVTVEAFINRVVKECGYGAIAVVRWSYWIGWLLGWLLSGWLIMTTAASAAQLTIADGVVVKFGAGAGLVVRDTLRSGRSVVFTSLADDTVSGQSQPTAGTPKPGDWMGLLLDPTALPDHIAIDGLSLRYAGGAGGAALSFQNHDYRFSALTVRDSLVGVRAVAGGTSQLTAFLLRGNGVGLQALRGATPTLTGSDLHANTLFGVENKNPVTPVVATGNWWGDASGPTDPVGNPTGRGDPVSTGVQYGQYLSAAPLLNCTLMPREAYTTRMTAVTLLLACANATDYRLSERPDLSDATFAPMATTVTFTLSATPGEKMVYVEYRGAEGQTRIVSLVQPIIYAPTGPQLTIIAPVNGAIITTDTLFQVQASDDQGLAQVDFWVDATRLATVTTPPYQTLWTLGMTPNGVHTLKAIATNTRQQTATAQVNVTVQRQDSDGPTVELLFNGGRWEAGATLTTPGTVTLKASDPNGVQTLVLQLDDQTLATYETGNATTATQSRTLDFANVANGAHTVGVIATDGVGNRRVVSIPFTLTLAAPSAPRLTTPVNGATLTQAALTVAGIAQVGSEVQLYLNSTASGEWRAVNTSGGFSTTLIFPAEGTYTLAAEARNARGIGPRSDPLTVHYRLPEPMVSFVTPAADAVLTLPTDIQVSAVDASGLVEVTLSVDGQPLTRWTQAPYQYRWDLSTVAEGTHVLVVVATAASGKSARAERTVTVRKTPPPPPPTPYTGELQTISPVLSYGPQPIQLVGRAVDRNGQPVANVPLRLVLQVNGYRRQIALASDNTGGFQYTFVPQESDAGVYHVAVVHPDETTLPDQGQFTINRVRFNLTQYTLLATRGFSATIPITASASAGTGVQGLRWVARPSDQPSGMLPAGIQIEGGAGIDLAPSASVPMSIGFRAEVGMTQETGTIFLVALAADSGEAVRGTLRVDYRLGDARPALFAEPTYLELGVRQGSSISGKVTIGNRGLAAATGVTAHLVSATGGTPPAWLFLASTPTLGVLDVGQSQSVQVTAVPGTQVTDGVYTAKIRIESANAIGGDVPVAVSVTQQGDGGIRFQVADIFTDTLDAQGQRIPGVANATLTVQNEAVTSVERRVVTDAQGVAVLDGLPTGVYRYRASAPNHVDASGRLQVQPGVTLNQAVFLDYTVINVSFSVTETTIQDHYDLTLTATYVTQVPAPVVLLEPLAVNLPDLQIGESISGELTLTNYGLVRADHLVFTLPTTDQYYQFEWATTPPTSLPAKTRVSLPYRITARTLLPQRVVRLEATPLMGPVGDQRYAEGLQRAIQPQDNTACSTYSRSATVQYDFTCANGDVRPSGATSVFSRLRGDRCGSGGGGGPIGGGGGPDVGGFGGPSGSPAPMPLTPNCTPDCSCKTCACAAGGSGPPGGPPAGPPGSGPGGGGGGDGSPAWR